MLFRLIVVVVALIAIVAVGGALFVAREGSPEEAAVGIVNVTLGRPASDDATSTRIVVKDGDTAATVGDRLAGAAVIRSALAFRLIVRLEGLEARLQAGTYELRPNMALTQVVASIAQGRMTGGFLTIPEGWRAAEVADALDRSGVTPRDDFLRYVQNPPDPTILDQVSAPSSRGLEGLLFPDSYRFEKGISADKVARQMVENFRSRLSVGLRSGFDANGLTVYQAVTLASIVEREAVAANERPIIASVYLNRLKRGMRLQADPTIQYALAGDGSNVPASVVYWKHALTFADLTVTSPYNTYRVTGLPPGPICNPGLASLLAVASPATTDYLYFVAKPDGTHAFAGTLQEQEQNVAKYQS